MPAHDYLTTSIGAMAMLLCATQGVASIAADPPIKASVSDSADGPWSVCGPDGCFPVGVDIAASALTKHICSSTGCAADGSGKLNASFRQNSMSININENSQVPIEKTPVNANSNSQVPFHVATTATTASAQCLPGHPPWTCKLAVDLGISLDVPDLGNSTQGTPPWNKLCATLGECRLVASKLENEAAVSWNICGSFGCISV